MQLKRQVTNIHNKHVQLTMCLDTLAGSNIKSEVIEADSDGIN